MAKIITSATPRELGYRMLAEWEKQTAVWLQWPEKYPDSNQQNRLSYQMKMEKTWLLMTWELHRHVRVCILVQSEKHRDHIFTTMDYFGFDMSRVEIHITHMADVWHRDSGPIFVVNDKGDLVLIPAFGNANDVKAQAVLVECYPDRTIVPISVVSLTAEGGAIHCVTQHQPAALGN